METDKQNMDTAPVSCACSSRALCEVEIEAALNRLACAISKACRSPSNTTKEVSE